MKKTDINEAYELFSHNSSSITREGFAQALVDYCTALVRQRHNDYFDTYEDAIGDTVLKVWESMGTFRGDCTFATWVAVILYNFCNDIHRRRKNREETLLSENEQEVDLGVKPSHSIDFERMVDTLDRGDRTIIGMRMEGKSREEIGDALGLPGSTISGRLAKIKKHLTRLASTKTWRD